MRKYPLFKQFNSQFMDSLHIPDNWRSFLLIFTIAFSSLIFIYFDTAKSIVVIWSRSETFMHGFFVIPFTLYMIWTQRETLKNYSPCTSWLGVVIIIPAIFLYLLGKEAEVNVLQHFSFLLMLWGLILGLFGQHVVRNLLFPIAFLFFAIPLGEGLIPLLMSLTAAITVKLLELSGFPVYWEGMLFSIPSGTFEVAKACSGVRYLFVTVTLGSLFAYLNYKSIWKRIIFISFSIFLPIIANGLRAYTIVLIAHFSEMKYATGVDHTIYGLIFFSLTIIILFYAGKYWRDDDAEVIISNKQAHTKIISRDKFKIFVYLSLLLVGPGILLLVQNKNNTNIDAADINLMPAKTVDGWTQSEETKWKPVFVNPTKQILVTYKKERHNASLYIAYYEKENQHSELINQRNSLFDANKWVQIETHRVSLDIAKDKTIILSQILLKRGSNQRVLWYWYDLSGYATPNSYKAKIIQAWGHLSGSSKGGAVIAISTEEENIHIATNNLKKFARAFYPEIQKNLENVRNRAGHD